MGLYKNSSIQPVLGCKSRRVEHKCTKCGKRHGVRYIDGEPQRKNPTCNRCGAPLEPVTAGKIRLGGIRFLVIDEASS